MIIMIIIMIPRGRPQCVDGKQNPDRESTKALAASNNEIQVGKIVMSLMAIIDDPDKDDCFGDTDDNDYDHDKAMALAMIIIKMTMAEIKMVFIRGFAAWSPLAPEPFITGAAYHSPHVAAQSNQHWYHRFPHHDCFHHHHIRHDHHFSFFRYRDHMAKMISRLKYIRKFLKHDPSNDLDETIR